MAGLRYRFQPLRVRCMYFQSNNNSI